MDGAIYVLSRKVQGSNGEAFMQNVTVFADSPTAARELVNAEFARLRRASKSPERPYLPTPPWQVDKVDLDEAKVITAGLTS
ncbi:MAG TPA: hypothetical protein VGQ68_06505 [Gaiellaceae bacterium]|jgi:hypothetical protein|nr:hypothetical protein [Gaiellaceae bacterium]